MISFNEWLRIIAEESRQERLAREMESERRADIYGNYVLRHRNHMDNRPKSPVGSPDWMAHAKNYPENPMDDFRNDVNEEIFKLTGLDWNHGAIIDGSTGGREEADADRVRRLIDDSWDDGSTPQETARMAIELIKSMGYLKNSG